MGVPYDLANAAIRISTSWATTEVEIQSALAALKRVIAAARPSRVPQVA